MSLRTKLVTATLLFTFILVALLSAVFLVEVLRERIAQTEAANGVLLHDLLASTSNALQHGLTQTTLAPNADSDLSKAITQALQYSGDVQGTLNGLVRYSPDLQDAYLSNAENKVILSSNPALLCCDVPLRRSFTDVDRMSTYGLWHLLFGNPETLDINLPLDRNSRPFLVAHLGLRSTFLRQVYSPWLYTASIVSLLTLVGALLVAATLSAAALRPIEQIERRLAELSGQSDYETRMSSRDDPVERVSSTINRLDAQMRTSEETRTQMATNLNSMLYALKDGVMLFTHNWLLVTASDAVRNFLPHEHRPASGTALNQVFMPESTLGRVLARAIQRPGNTIDEPVELEDGRKIEFSLDRGAGNGTGALLTLHDAAAEQKFGRELEVSQRMASIGRLMASVGHEVKNPINAMVVHLELLRGKLEHSAETQAAQRHVDVLSSEMRRLDRVVQTLADFSRPIEPVLEEQGLRPVLEAVVALIQEEARAQHIAVYLECERDATVCDLRCDGELLRQAVLNIALNAMQAMPEGGTLKLRARRDRQMIELMICDTGVGIPADALQRIFDLYFTTKPAGSGIGLSMTYRIVQMHGGVIQVTSEATPGAVNRGTTFTIRLPLASKSRRSL